MTLKPTPYDAVLALVGGTISSLPDGEIVYHSGQTPPTEKAIQDKLKELQAEYDAQAYARVRRPLYPPIGDQLDDLYKQGVFSDEMAAKIKKVKDDNPKPS